MTVQQLIIELQSLPQDALVIAGEAVNSTHLSEVDEVRIHKKSTAQTDWPYELEGLVQIGVTGMGLPQTAVSIGDV